MLTVPSPGRSRNMAAIRRRDTSPELRVRHSVHGRGFRYRVDDRRLAGRPDLVFPRYRLAVFVHGCFWHGHRCARAGKPTKNVEYWHPKIEGNKKRDRRSAISLRHLGWRVLTIRECQLERGLETLLEELESLRADEQTYRR
jgi:DNA mismatch endonuclease Vsr